MVRLLYRSMHQATDQNSREHHESSRDEARLLVVTSYSPESFGGSSSMLHSYLQRMPTRPIEILTSHRDYGGKTAESLPFPEHYYDQIPRQGGNPPHHSRWTSLKILLSSPFLLFFQIFRIVRSGRAILKRGTIKHLLLISDSGPALVGGFALAVSFRLPFSLLFFDLYRGNRLLPGER